MYIEALYNDLYKQMDRLEKNISMKIEGNCEDSDNYYYYSKEDREQMRQELKNIESIINHMDKNKMYE